MLSVAPAAGVQADEPLAVFEKIVQEELARGFINGVSIALVDDDKIVYAKGFGLANVEAKTPATPQTVYRAGSISKLFTAVAAMQLVEEGKLDLDAPLAKSNPGFRICNPFDGQPPITLRQLMCHRSGMVREAPIGGYFDDHEPSLDTTLASLADCVLVNPPDTKTRYSNVGPSIVGQTVTLVSGKKFEDFTQERILNVVGMPNSAWTAIDAIEPRISVGYMRVAQTDGTFQRIPAPRFELGTIPAGNLYTTVEDLGAFITYLVNAGGRDGKRLVKPETLAEMYRPQGSNDARTFGLGFALGKFREEATVTHMGAVYGFTSSLVAIPSKKVGAVVLANEDIAVGSVQRLMTAALNAVLDRQAAAAPPDASTNATEPATDAPAATPAPAPAEKRPLANVDLTQFVGQYESASYWAEFAVKEGRLHAVISGQPMTLEPTGEHSFKANGQFVFDAPIVFERSESGVFSCTALRQKFEKVDPANPAPAPEHWSKFVGSYGPSFIPLIVSIRHGHLYALAENEMDYRLTPLNRFVFRLPPGMYDDEHIVFQEGPDGTVHAVVMANFALKRIAK